MRLTCNGLLAHVYLHSINDRQSSLEGDEKVVYQCIKAADNKGIWTKDLKQRTNLHQTIITKTLKSLESKRLIKAVKSVKNSTRKVYMLAHLEPSVEITGGPWFSENELDTEFIEELCKVCFRYIASKVNILDLCSFNNCRASRPNLAIFTRQVMQDIHLWNRFVILFRKVALQMLISEWEMSPSSSTVSSTTVWLSEQYTMAHEYQ